MSSKRFLYDFELKEWQTQSILKLLGIDFDSIHAMNLEIVDGAASVHLDTEEDLPESVWKTSTYGNPPF